MATMPKPAFSILLVEDEKVSLELLTSILTMKYPASPLHTATNGRAGLELFKTHLPAIVITDINMPEMGGVQMAENIRGLKPDTKFVILTGNSSKIGRQDASENEFAFGHNIMKPVNFALLFAAIEQCLVEITQDQSP